jgi:hypothetical protein
MFAGSDMFPDNRDCGIGNQRVLSFLHQGAKADSNPSEPLSFIAELILEQPIPIA